jgi:ABC-2 type transport system permease protein
MLSAISAEALKFRRHRATWFLVWIWPIGILLLGTIGVVVGLVNAEGPGDGKQTALEWVRNAAGFWAVPGHAFGRYLIGTFVAVVFAGEYGWNTWKLIVPHRARPTLIAAKYVVALALLIIGFTLGAIVFNLTIWVEDILTGDTLPEGITASALVATHASFALGALPPILLTAAYVSLAAILTRSTVAALVIGLVVTTLEQLFRGVAPLVEPYASTLVMAMYEVLPGYHVSNLTNWATDGQALPAQFQWGVFSAHWGVSLANVAVWVILLVGLTFWRFRRQDIN